MDSTTCLDIARNLRECPDAGTLAGLELRLSDGVMSFDCRFLAREEAVQLEQSLASIINDRNKLSLQAAAIYSDLCELHWDLPQFHEISKVSSSLPASDRLERFKKCYCYRNLTSDPSGAISHLTNELKSDHNIVRDAAARSLGSYVSFDPRVTIVLLDGAESCDISDFSGYLYGLSHIGFTPDKSASEEPELYRASIKLWAESKDIRTRVQMLAGRIPDGDSTETRMLKYVMSRIDRVAPPTYLWWIGVIADARASDVDWSLTQEGSPFVNPGSMFGLEENARVVFLWWSKQALWRQIRRIQTALLGSSTYADCMFPNWNPCNLRATLQEELGAKWSTHVAFLEPHGLDMTFPSGSRVKGRIVLKISEFLRLFNL